MATAQNCDPIVGARPFRGDGDGDVNSQASHISPPRALIGLPAWTGSSRCSDPRDGAPASAGALLPGTARACLSKDRRSMQHTPGFD
ncbi:hypothetical protein GGI07_003414 [Coemansia sp. Benny D115]|nr:hypothetical protein GGI07_003414 [Coemansia sp. Benny D115]